MTMQMNTETLEYLELLGDVINSLFSVIDVLIPNKEQSQPVMKNIIGESKLDQLATLCYKMKYEQYELTD